MIATAALGWRTFTDRGSQPIADGRNYSQEVAASQNVVARLWEDPLQAVQVEIARKGASASTDVQLPGSSHSAAAMRIAVNDTVKAGNKVCLLVVPIPATPFPNDLEVRHRLRYSIQMALAHENYAPDNRDYLGYFSFYPDRTVKHASGESNPTYIPYEWFTSRSAAAKLNVLVLWLPESLLGRRDVSPLTILAEMRNDLYPMDDGNLVGLFVVGPRSSDTLTNMIPGKGGDIDSCDRELLRNKLTIFSAESTAPDGLIGLETREKWSEARQDFAVKLYDTFKEKDLRPSAPGTLEWKYFYNFIATDDQLTDLLVVELGLRGFNFKENNDKILVLAEADTSYGRFLPVALQASIESYKLRKIQYFENSEWLSEEKEKLTSATSAKCKEIDSQPPEPNSTLIVCRYLRGLDQQKGQEGTSKQHDRSNAKSPEELLAETLNKERPMSLGESQLDYTDRLADAIKQTSAVGPIKAIGVLGADIYDKLILLRSLRPKFPEAIFFTTDLDARLWHPDYLSFTRNMVVASAYDIKLSSGQNGDDSGQKTPSFPRIAPFRDVYQRAVFEACRAALKKAAADPSIDKLQLPLPSVFEIGKSGQVQLKRARRTVGFIAGGKKMMQAGCMKVVSIPQAKGLILFVAGLLILLVLWRVQNWSRSKHHREIWLFNLDKPERRWLVCAMAGSLLVVVCGCVAKSLGELPSSEPWAWNEGVSVWPTELLRLIIAISVITILVWAWQRFTKGRDQLINNFFFDVMPSITPRIKCIFHPWPSSLSFNSGVSARVVYKVYLRRAALRCRAVRTFVATCAYFALAMGVIYFVDGQLPYRPHVRGNLAQSIDSILLYLSTFSFAVLLFYVLDAVCLSAQMLFRITGRRTNWPFPLLKLKMAQYRIQEPKELAGYLDVKFAAEKSKEVGRLIIFPFFVQFIFVLSRNIYFDNWTWPRGLTTIFIINIVLAGSAWLVLRSAAKRIREEALKILKEDLRDARHNMNLPPSGGSGGPPAPPPGGSSSSDGNRPDTNGSQARKLKTDRGGISKKGERAKNTSIGTTVLASPSEAPTENEGALTANYAAPSSKERYEGLLELKQEIEDERDGAYSQFFQDPALIAAFLPSGLLGIASVLSSALFHT